MTLPRKRNLFVQVQKWVAVTFLFFIVYSVLPSFPIVRNTLAAPLALHEQNASGNVCYVLAGGDALLERLDAAADLVQMGRVEYILLMQDGQVGQFSFKSKSSWTRTQWVADYLAWRGIPIEKILWIQQANGRFGTLTEARAVSKGLSKEVKTLVVVSSAPHMRRAVLAFKRSVPANVRVVPYAATTFENSYEKYHPIWVEYLKLFVYYVIA